MFKALVRSIEGFFAPVFEFLGNLPPRAINRLFAPF